MPVGARLRFKFKVLFPRPSECAALALGTRFATRTGADPARLAANGVRKGRLAQAPDPQVAFPRVLHQVPLQIPEQRQIDVLDVCLYDARVKVAQWVAVVQLTERWTRNPQGAGGNASEAANLDHWPEMGNSNTRYIG